MSIRLFTAASILALAAACNQSATNPTNVATTNASAPPPQPQSERLAPAMGVSMYARCSSTMRALGRLYTALANSDRRSGRNPDESLALARARETAADTFRTMALEAGASIGRVAADVDRIIAEQDATYEDRSRNGPFEQFATQLGRDGDSCTALLAPPG